MFTKEEYLAFMYNPANIGNCKSCPHKDDIANHQSGNPCGQYNCWVSAHCGVRPEVKGIDFLDD